MATFQFYTDTKVTMWERATFEIEAETRYEAIEMAKKCAKSDNYPSNVDYETLYDTSEELLVNNNNGEATKELYIDNEDMIWTNTNEGYND